ncbi:MAG: DUF4232 domain-containing protein [Umezawaea sp.]
MGGNGLARVVVAVAAVGLLAACGGKGAGGTATPPASGSSEVKASDSFTSNAAGSTENCTKVKVGLGTLKAAETGQTQTQPQEQMKLPLTMTNTGPAPCVLRGFPGVRLQARDGDGWDITRTGDAVTDVQLPAGGTATSYLTFLSQAGGTGWGITSVVVTPPNTEDSQTFEWPGGPVLRQDAATHPGTYVGPVGVWGSGVS